MNSAEPASPGLTRDDVAKVAQLALLDLDDAEIERFTEQLGAVLDRAQELAAFDTAGVPPTAHPYPLVNVFRADSVEADGADHGASADESVRAEALAAAPDREDDQFKVPPALGEEP